MAVQLTVSQVIDRPLAKVFRFYAIEHVRNHPRWDPDIELWFEAIDDHHTVITTILELPGIDESMDKSFLLSRLERSDRNRKQLIESEIQE